jgi:hypothetical protein
MSYPPPPGQSPYPPGPPPYGPPPSGPPQYGGGYGAPPKHLRGRTPLRLALIFGVVGLALVIVGAIIIAKKSFSAVDNFQRVSVASGTGTVSFTNAGNYLAYYEADNVNSGIKSVPVPLVALQSPSGKDMTLDTLYGGGNRASGQIKTRLTYGYNGHKGVAIYQFKITETGQYKVQVQATAGTAPNSDIAFGKSIGGGIALGAGLVVPGALLLVTAIILLIIGLVKRSRHKKQIAAGAGGGYGGPPPPNYPYPPQGPQPPPAWPAAPEQ